MRNKAISMVPVPGRGAGERREDPGDTDLIHLVRRRPGVRLLQGAGSRWVCGAGVPVALSVKHLLQQTTKAQSLESLLSRLADERSPVTITLTGLSKVGDPVRGLHRVCEQLQVIAQRAGFDPSLLGLALHSHQVPAQAYWFLSHSTLGDGPRYLYLDPLQMRRHDNRRIQEANDRNWRLLWQHRHLPSGLVPVYGGVVRSACRLLSDEVAPSVLPLNGALVPSLSAWVAIELDVSVYASADGQLDFDALLSSVEDIVKVAEIMHDQSSWSCRQQRSDAYLNRRVAVSLTGLGKLVQDTRQDPRALATLVWLGNIVNLIRDELRRKSAQLAQSAGPAPAIAGIDPSGMLHSGSARESWAKQWNAAVRTCSLRHRNLLVISPVSVLPESGSCNAAFADLLPAIRFADAWCFSATARMSGWNIDEFQKFHRRAWAIINDHRQGCVVAAGV